MGKKKQEKESVQEIKGYLPVRVIFHSEDDMIDQTFFYIKEHFATNSSGDNGRQNSSTLFVANAPFFPNISTKTLLRSLLGRYGEIERISVVDNPRRKKKETCTSLINWGSSKDEHVQYYPSIIDEKFLEKQGRFSHVVFRSNKEMKKVLRSLHKVMSLPNEDEEFPSLELGKLEIQTLQDESSTSKYNDDSEKSTTGILAVSQRYRQTMERNINSRHKLLNQCNKIIRDYEGAEEEALLAKKNPSVDDDGFVTVTYSSTAGNKRSLEEGLTASSNGEERKGGSKRSRTKKKISGADELPDFYRFQQKETRKQNVQELRLRFQQDLEKVKRLKEEKHYRPFS